MLGKGESPKKGGSVNGLFPTDGPCRAGGETADAGGNLHAADFAKLIRGARFQLPLQMPPFVKQLAACLGDLAGRAAPANFGGVKFVAAPPGFLADGKQAGGNRGGWFGGSGKANELRMMPLAFG
jgi:hypothetical protein